MTEMELGDFLKHHDALFPGVRKWWQDGDRETVRTRSEAWLKRLAPHSLPDCKRASSALFETREKPPYFGQQLDWVCNHLRPRPLLNDDRAPHIRRCELCRGSGMVSVQFFEAQQTEGGCDLENREGPNIGPVACKCSKGQWINERRRAHNEGRPLQVFDATRMRVHRLTLASDITARLEHMETTFPRLAAAVAKVWARKR